MYSEREGSATLSVSQRIEAEREQPPRERDAGDLLPTPARDGFLEATQRWVLDRPRCRLDHHPAQPARALLRVVATPGVLVTRALSRGEPGPTRDPVGYC